MFKKGGKNEITQNTTPLKWKHMTMAANSKYDISYIKNLVLDRVCEIDPHGVVDQRAYKETNTSWKSDNTRSGPQRSSGSRLVNLWVDFSLSEW